MDSTDSEGLRQRLQASDHSLDEHSSPELENENNNNNNNSNNGENTQQSSLPDPQPNDEKTCRICFSTEDESDESLGRLFSPCLCKGTMKYVHVECLNHWRLVNRQKMYQCSSCNYIYNFRRTSFAKVITNEFVLSIITLALFMFVVFASGFVIKVAFKLLWAFIADDTEEADSIYKELNFDMLTWREVFTVNFEHMTLGLFGVGIVGFIQLAVTMLFVGPLPYFNSYHYRTIRASSRESDSSTKIGILVIIVAIGSVKLMWVMYKKVKLRLKLGLQEAILEVNEA